MTLIYSLIAVLLVSSISLMGIVALAINQRLLKSILFFLVSLSVGTLFGDALLHLIPEAFADTPSQSIAALFVLLGIIVFFILEKVFRWHHKHTTLEEENAHCHDEHHTPHLGPLIIVSDGVHNFLDGIIIAAGFLISPEIGIATTIAVVLHEIPQEIGDFALLLHAGFSRIKAIIFNFLSALTSLLGVGAAFLLAGYSDTFVPLAAAFAAGGFLYIAGADLVPELHKQTAVRISLLQLFAILLGIGIMVALLFLE